MSDDDLTGAFVIPEGEDHPAVIAERLLLLPEHAHLRENEIAIEYLFRAEPKLKAGKAVLGSVHLPSCQGEMRAMFEWLLIRQFGYLPDFLCILDQAFWLEAAPITREALLFHELAHVQQDVDAFGAPKFNKQTGRAVYRLVGHDLEEFNSVVARYGAWRTDIADFIAAAGQ